MRITHRLQFIKLIVVIGMLISVLLTFNLWAGFRWFPKAPLFDNYTGITAPYDYINLVIFVVLLFISFFSRKMLPVVLLILFSIYLCIDDQNRLQPWFYYSILILFILLFYKQRVDEPNNYINVFISIQILVALIYIYSGIQKINAEFVPGTFNWMINAVETNLSSRQIIMFTKFGYTIPYFQIVLGISLLVKQFRFIALPLVIIMQLLFLVMLFYAEKSNNLAMWPWHIVMIALILLLFSGINQERFFDISFLFKGVCFYIVLTFMLIFPFFSLSNKYDSFLSGALYSSNLSDCQIILNDRAYNKLPYYIRHYVVVNSNYNILNVKKWVTTELHTPFVPEYRVFLRVHQYIINITDTNNKEVVLNFIERDKILDL